MEKGKPSIRQLSAFTLLVVLVTLFASKVLSPQYIIWLFPLLPLAVGRLRYVVWTAFIVIGGLTYYLFPWHYYDLTSMENWAVAVLLIRNCLFIIMAILICVSLVRESQSKGILSGQRLAPPE
jgi:hypothetical protein